LVTGPTGHGKSTTLAAMINYINSKRRCHIVTIEDPIEYLHRHNKSIINQREIGSDTKSYANALRAVLREDPDVILIGEMRDQETIATALTAAETVTWFCLLCIPSEQQRPSTELSTFSRLTSSHR